MISVRDARTVKMVMSTRLEALGNLKASLAPTPLWVYLYLYTKADRECYLNYMEGAKALARWLGKIEMPHPILRSIPKTFYNYETFELAKIVNPTRLAQKQHETEKKIVTCLIEEVMPRL